jgi:hypothetical protein
MAGVGRVVVFYSYFLGTCQVAKCLGMFRLEVRSWREAVCVCVSRSGRIVDIW